MAGPSRIRLRTHAERRGIGLDTIEELVLERFASRRANAGHAAWRVERRGVVVLFDHPVDGDETVALVRSAWRAR